MKAPSIYMLTPSGRFQINTKICMSMSDFHPESWNPLWSVATIIQGVQSFMASDELTTGGLKASVSDREQFAKLSAEYNKKTYPNLFQGNIQGALEKADQARQKAEEENLKKCTAGSSNIDQNSSSSRRSRRLAKKKQEEDNKSGGNHDEGNKALTAATKILSQEEIEKRRKRNAKKRAKQKAKKAQEVRSEPIPNVDAKLEINS